MAADLKMHQERVLHASPSVVRAVPAARRATTRAADSAWPLSALTVASPDEPILGVLRRIGEEGDGRVLVLSNGELVGIVTPTDISRAVQAAEIRHAA